MTNKGYIIGFKPYFQAIFTLISDIFSRNYAYLLASILLEHSFILFLFGANLHLPQRLTRTGQTAHSCNFKRCRAFTSFFCGNSFSCKLWICRNMFSQPDCLDWSFVDCCSWLPLYDKTIGSQISLLPPTNRVTVALRHKTLF